jgi:hypothetical protein
VFEKKNDLPKKEGDYDANTDIADKEKKAGAQNHLAIAYFTITFTSPMLMGMIDAATNDDYPSGRANKVVELLNAKYRPVDQIAIVEKQLAMKGIKLAKHEDPDVLFEKLATVVNKFRNSVSVETEDQIATVMETALDMYLSAITSTLERRGTNLTLGNLQSTMKELYRIRRAKRADEEDDDEDAPKMALGGADGIKCYNCGADGHKAFECPLKKKRQPRFTGTCNNCGKQGHKDANCWDKEENAHKRPKNLAMQQWTTQ